MSGSRLAALASSLDEMVPEVLRMTGPPGLSVAVGHGGETLARAYGRHDLESRRAMSTTSLFPVGSITKLYTAIAILQLVESGVVGLHDPVEAHLHGVRCRNPFGAREVTVNDLLTFRSGLAVDSPASSLTDPPPLLEHVGAAYEDSRGRAYARATPRWSTRVGQRHLYANLGISTLGLLVEQRNPDGLDLPSYLRRHVFEPLDMTATWLSRWDYDAPHPDRASGYACYGGHAVPTPEIRSADHPADGLHTTPSDHLRLLRALLAGGGSLLRRETVRLMLTPQVAVDGGEGFWPGGWYTGLVAIMTGLGGREARFGHPGSHPWGWWSTSWAYPELDCAVVACANGWDMLRWHNPANRDATVLVAEAVGAFFADAMSPGTARQVARSEAPQAQSPSWAWKRGYVAGALLAERTAGLLGVPDRLPAAYLDGRDEGFRAGVVAAGRAPIGRARAAAVLRHGAGAPPPEQLEALLQDLGMVYGCPLPLWLWPEPVPEKRRYDDQVAGEVEVDAVREQQLGK